MHVQQIQVFIKNIIEPLHGTCVRFLRQRSPDPVVGLVAVLIRIDVRMLRARTPEGAELLVPGRRFVAHRLKQIVPQGVRCCVMELR